jgi:hypothetical protein
MSFTWCDCNDPKCKLVHDNWRPPKVKVDDETKSLVGLLISTINSGESLTQEDKELIQAWRNTHE